MHFFILLNEYCTIVQLFSSFLVSFRVLVSHLTHFVAYTCLLFNAMYCIADTPYNAGAFIIHFS